MTQTIDLANILKRTKEKPMSILIKGIDIPNCSNEDCIVVIRHDKAEVWQTGYKERTVEAIQIPTPHGRLIDGGELYKDFENYCSGECDCCVHETENYNCGLIANAPTILEAEE